MVEPKADWAKDIIYNHRPFENIIQSGSTIIEPNVYFSLFTPEESDLRQMLNSITLEKDALHIENSITQTQVKTNRKPSEPFTKPAVTRVEKNNALQVINQYGIIPVNQSIGDLQKERHIQQILKETTDNDHQEQQDYQNYHNYQDYQDYQEQQPLFREKDQQDQQDQNTFTEPQEKVDLNQTINPQVQVDLDHLGYEGDVSGIDLNHLPNNVPSLTQHQPRLSQTPKVTEIQKEDLSFDIPDSLFHPPHLPSLPSPTSSFSSSSSSSSKENDVENIQVPAKTQPTYQKPILDESIDTFQYSMPSSPKQKPSNPSHIQIFNGDDRDLMETILFGSKELAKGILDDSLSVHSQPNPLKQQNQEMSTNSNRPHLSPSEAQRNSPLYSPDLSTKQSIGFSEYPVMR